MGPGRESLRSLLGFSAEKSCSWSQISCPHATRTLLPNSSGRAYPLAQRPPRPHEVDDWLENVSLALTIATGLGCWRQWSIERRAGPVVTPPGLFGEAAARAVAEVNVRRLRRVLDAGLSRGMFLGTLTAVWCAAETASGLYRGSGPHRDVWDSMAASSFVGAVWGTLGGRVTWGRAVAAGAAGGVCGRVTMHHFLLLLPALPPACAPLSLRSC